MSVFVYKNGKEELIPPEYLDQYLNGGWSTQKDEEPEKPKKTKKKKVENDKASDDKKADGA